MLNDDRTALSEFLTVGLEPEEEERIGARPTGRGVLGLLISDPRPLRIGRLGTHPESHGFPPNHPPMTSFLGVPSRCATRSTATSTSPTRSAGPSSPGRRGADRALAVAAGIAIENARLHERVTEVAVYEERDRLARDLHDTVIQRLFAIGLSLQSMAANPSAGRNADRLTATIGDIDDTIRQVRTSIFELGPEGLGRGVRHNVLSLIEELRPVVGFEVRAAFEGPVDTAVPDIVLEHLLAVLREAVTNIGRHAKATAASPSAWIQGCGSWWSTTAVGWAPRDQVGRSRSGQHETSGREAPRQLPSRVSPPAGRCSHGGYRSILTARRRWLGPSPILGRFLLFVPCNPESATGPLGYRRKGLRMSVTIDRPATETAGGSGQPYDGDRPHSPWNRHEAQALGLPPGSGRHAHHSGALGRPSGGERLQGEAPTRVQRRADGGLPRPGGRCGLRSSPRL